MDRAIQHSLSSFEYEQENTYNETLQISRTVATEDLIEDAVIELSGLGGNPWTRLRLLAVLGLDDLQTNIEEDEDLKVRIGVIKTYMEGFIYSSMDPSRDPAYEDAMGYIDAADSKDLPVYNAVLPFHHDMCIQEEEEKRAEEQERIAVEEAERLAKEAERLAEEKKTADQKETAREARLRYYAKP